MARRWLLAVGVAALACGPALSGPFEEGLDAYNRGDFGAARRLWQPLAEGGHVDAQFHLGYLFANGQGVAQDHAEAARWTRMAADRGEPAAQFALGVMYANGEGVPQDDVRAYLWFDIAARQTDPERRHRAARNRDLVALKLSPAQAEEAARLAREWRPGAGR